MKNKTLTNAKKQYVSTKRDLIDRVVRGEKNVEKTMNHALQRTEKRYDRNHLAGRKIVKFVLIGIVVAVVSFCAGRISTMKTQGYMYKTFVHLQQVDDISRQYNKMIDQLGYAKERASNTVYQETQKLLDTAKTIQERIEATTKLNELIDEQRLFLKEKGW